MEQEILLLMILYWWRTRTYHGDLPPKLWGKYLLVLKTILSGLEFFLISMGESPYEGSQLGRESTIKNWIVYLFLYFFNSARWYSCIKLIVLSYVLVIMQKHCVSKIRTWQNNDLFTEFFLILWVWWLFDLI